MSPGKRFHLAATLPLAIILASLWLLVGCLYIPTPERLHLTGSRQDFRPLVGRPGSQRAIVERRISRAAVEALLGPPPYASANGRRLMYVIHLKKGVWIMPLCFTVASGQDKAIGLLMDFDKTGMLMDWERLEDVGSLRLVPDSNFGLDAEARIQSSTESNLANAAKAVSLSGSTSQPNPDEWNLKSTRDAKPD